MRDQVAADFDKVREGRPQRRTFPATNCKASGKTLEQLKAAYLEKKLAPVVLVRELAPSNALSDDAIKRFYEDEKNAAHFTIPERVHVAHILISELDPVTKAIAPARPEKGKRKGWPGRSRTGPIRARTSPPWSGNTPTTWAARTGRRDHLRPPFHGGPLKVLRPHRFP